ncbi:MAG: heavy-metal-associated domain-containing protein [Moraxellaceae bacterium]|nr:heavy-metal-associated domain-containing protein [Moraxellaceae bacterium]
MFVIQVKGISCGHCVNAITQALTELDSKAKVQIDKTSQTVRFNGNASQADVVLAIKESGYEVVGVIKA